MSNQLGNIPIDILPRICIYDPDKPILSQYYDIDERCPCGGLEWYMDKIDIKLNECEYHFPMCFVYKCQNCHQIRLARMKKRFEAVISTSKTLLAAFQKTGIDKDMLADVISTMSAHLENNHNTEKIRAIK